MVDADNDRICKMCNRIILDEEGGQVVLFDIKEAKLRHLPYQLPGDDDED